MAEYSTLKNKIELPSTHELLKDIKLYFYWEEDENRIEEDKANCKQYLKWELYWEADPEKIDTTTFYGILFNRLRIDITTDDGTYQIDPDVAKRFNFVDGYSGLVYKALTGGKRLCCYHSYKDGTASPKLHIRFSSVRIYKSKSSYTIESDDLWKVKDYPITVKPVPMAFYVDTGKDVDFTSTQYPIIYCEFPKGSWGYENAASNIEKLEVCISLTGGNDDVPYREVTDISNSGNCKYTFQLTRDERAALQPVLDNGGGIVRFYAKTTYKDGTTYWDYRDVEYTEDNGIDLVLLPYVEDINPATIALTGDEDILVKYMSTAQFEVGANARGGAILTEQTLTHESGYFENVPEGIIEEVESGKFTFTATDSKGANKKVVLNKPMIDYFLPICKQRAKISFEGESSAKATISISGSFFNGNFGATGNSIALYIRHTQNDGTMSDWNSLDALLPNIDGNSFNLEFNINGLRYDMLYTFQCKAVDKLTEGLSEEYSTRAAPLFDWSENDFNFNVPVAANEGMSITGDLTVNEGKVLGMYILSDSITDYDVSLNDSIANYDIIEILYADNNGKTYGSLKVPAGTTNTLTVTLSLIQPRYFYDEEGLDNQTMIRATTYTIQGENITLNENGDNQGIVYLDDTFTKHYSDRNYIKILKVLGYK